MKTSWLISIVLLFAGSIISPIAQAQNPQAGDSISKTATAAPGKNALAPDIKAAALWDGRRLTPFRAANFPKMVKAADADFLDDDEYVLGIT
ncbi:MAG TPA: hypothetical protein VFB38_12005, partial [Chthonomonadaceae bacterium]|nr:hypothetical protein [Chthonomonadaceae bacterium]